MLNGYFSSVFIEDNEVKPACNCLKQDITFKYVNKTPERVLKLLLKLPLKYSQMAGASQVLNSNPKSTSHVLY